MHFIYVILQCKKYCYKYKVLNYKVDLKQVCPLPGNNRGENRTFTEEKVLASSRLMLVRKILLLC